MRKTTKIILATFYLILTFTPYVFPDYRTALDAYKVGDYTTALKKWRTLSEKDDPEAQYRLCTVYRRAHGVKKNNEKAFSYCKKSAKQGHILAQVRLGLMYKKGEGTKKTLTHALMWFNIASDKGNSFAIKMGKKIKKTMSLSDIQKSLDLASNWKRKQRNSSCTSKQ
ncbi:MAG: tetratricopeptide repeat protein [Nitrospinota bacterium]|nr:tetratricopeptide repeat protein [Nitrospinota bacterium]